MKKATILFMLFLFLGDFSVAAQNVILLDGTLFGNSQKTGLEYVLQLNPDRLLNPCDIAMGKKPKAANYGGWEARDIHGHSLGHYLSALSGFVAATDSKEAEEKLVYTINRIKSTQRADGYYGGIPSTVFDKCFRGEIIADRFGLNGGWVPWYSVHKIYAGLIDAYVLTGNRDALDIVIKMADWAEKGMSDMTDEQVQKMLACEHGGMCKVFADLYDITKNKKYLDCAERWVHQEIVKPLFKKVDKLQGYHANTQLPKIIGLAKLYDLTGKEDYRKAVEFFFETVTQRRSYVIGGNSVGEHFGLELEEKLGRDTCETCNTYNMLEIAEYVFKWNKNSSIADFYETALYNHILASQDPVTGAKTYFISMLPGYFKIYGTTENSFWCCTGTGMENPSCYGRFIAKDYDGTIYINLFIPSKIVTEDGWEIQIDTDFPYEQEATIQVLKEGKNPRELKIRQPAWTRETPVLDGYVLATKKLSGEYSIKVDLPMSLNLRRTRDRSGNFSVLYGPIVLAADMGTKSLPKDIVDDHLVHMSAPAQKMPIITADIFDLDKWIKLVNPDFLEFEMSASATENGKSYRMRPFFDIHHVRYATYFNTGEAPVDLRTQKLESIRIDSIEPGRQQSEIEHRFKAQSTEMDYIPEVDRNCRRIVNKDGFISYQMRLNPSIKNKLVLTTYGEDKGTFIVQIDDEKPVVVILDGTKGKVLVDTEIPVSDVMLKEKGRGKKSLRVIVTLKTDSVSPRLLEIHSVKD